MKVANFPLREKGLDMSISILTISDLETKSFFDYQRSGNRRTQLLAECAKSYFSEVENCFWNMK